MALPLPRVVPDVGPGGGLVTAMGGINSLANDNILRQINEIKKTYLPITTQAEAASKLAYANLMGPQFMAKLLGNDAAVANMGDQNARIGLQKAMNAGMGNGNANNFLNQLQHTGVGQPSTNSFSGFVSNALKGLLGRNQTENIMQNAFSNPYGQEANQNQGQMPIQQMPIQKDNINHTIDEAFLDWANSPEGMKEIEKGEAAVVPTEQELMQRLINKSTPAMSLQVNEGQKYNREPTWAEKTGQLKGGVKEGEELGKFRAKTINDIGEQQLNLSNSGVVLDKLINDINDPKFVNLRKEFPFYQNMQLKALSKVGNPETQEMIGEFIADLQNFAGSTVNSFKGQTMKREFDYAEKLKPNENDTVNIARGKLTALKTVKEIAERKNDIILDLMQNKHMNLGDAVKKANKMVDIKSVDKQVKELTQPMITIKNKKTGELITVTAKKAREMGVPNV